MEGSHSAGLVELQGLSSLDGLLSSLGLVFCFLQVQLFPPLFDQRLSHGFRLELFTFLEK